MSEARSVTAIQLVELSREYEVSQEFGGTPYKPYRILYACERPGGRVEVRYEDPTVGNAGRRWYESTRHLGIVIHLDGDDDE